MNRLTPGSLRVGYGATLADRPAASSPSLQVGDRWLAREGSLLSTLVENQFGSRSWSVQTTAKDVLVAAGQGALDGAGSLVVVDAAVDPISRFVLQFQAGAGPNGNLWPSVITPGVGFQISSTSGAVDAGLLVYWQRWLSL